MASLIDSIDFAIPGVEPIGEGGSRRGVVSAKRTTYTKARAGRNGLRFPD